MAVAVTDHQPLTASPTSPHWRLIGLVATAWAALAAVLFLWSGRFSVAAVGSACGAPAPDVRTAPPVAEIRTFLAACGPDGLAAYRDLQLMDLLYPAANAALLVLVLLLLLRRLPRQLRWVTLLPVIAAIADYLENVAAWTLLARGVDGSTWAEHLFQLASAAKVAATWASWLAVLVLLAWVAVGAVRRRGTARDSAAGRGRRHPASRAR